MPLLALAFGLISWLIPMIVSAQQAAEQPNCIRLWEPFMGVDCIPVGGGPLDAFFFYFNLVYPWIVGLAAGIAVLMGLIGGMQMMMSGGDQGKQSEGKNRLLWSMGGLLFLIFSSMILNAINPSFYR